MNMNNSLLPKEAVTLVQHIELNKAGWWEKAVQRLVLATVWLSIEPPDADVIQSALKANFKLSIATPKVMAALESLESRQMLLRLPSGTYKIPAEQRAVFEKEIADSEKVELEAKASFYRLVSDATEELVPEKVWDGFQQELLGPLIKQVGVNAYRFVAGERMKLDQTLVDNFLQSFPIGHHEKLRALVIAFIDPKNPEVCAYIGRVLHARFCVEASGLPEDVLTKLIASVGKQIRFLMFVDTNFLFSLMEIHENPSNAAAKELRELVEQLKGNLRIELVVTPDTIEEAKSSIAYTKAQLKGLPVGGNFTQAALHARFSGMAVRFLTERLQRNGKLTVDDWFDPYLKDFVPLARSKGVELFNEKLDGYSTRQDVVDDIHVVFKFEERLPENRRKSYPKVAHDMILWHFVQDQRPAYIESPIDANYWILTVDYRLIGFDEHKRKYLTTKVPLCIHPTTLIQLLQFWIPRTKEFEEAMLGSLRLPFLFQDFDVEGEKTSLKILKGIGRFDGSEGLSEETITQVMLNDGLRSRLQSGDSEEAEVAIIRDALVEEMRQRAEQEASKAKGLEDEVRKRESDIAALADQKRSAEAESAQRKKQKEEAEEAARGALAQQSAEMENLKAKVRLMEDTERARASADAQKSADAERKRALLCYFAMLFTVCGCSAVAAWWLEPFVPQIASVIGTPVTRGTIAIVVFVVCHLALELTVGRKDPMKSLWPFLQISRLRAWLWSFVILTFILSGVCTKLVANNIQQNIDKRNPETTAPAVSIGPK
jgi:hypothetical protein